MEEITETSGLDLHPRRKVTYFERCLVTRENPVLFEPADFTWAWSRQKKGVRKEQLSALHGLHSRTGKKWFAWHGRGENQLHFTGEQTWWPEKNYAHSIDFRLPDEEGKIDFETLAELLARLPQE